MLPELLFSVGGSMQDISRDDFNLLNGGCDKDVSCVTRSSPPLPPQSTSPTGGYNANTPPPGSTSDSPNLDASNIKLEDSSRDLYSAPSWHHPELESSKLLLKNSDDPLISRGATTVDDDNPSELSSIVASAQVNVQTTSPAKPPSRRNRNVGTTATRARRKGTFKLRFHHQALPAEYLNHYEATQNQQNRSRANNCNTTTGSKKAEASTHDSVRSWLQKISEMQAASNELKESVEVSENVSTDIKNTGEEKSPRRVVKYSDLPYMGEMTLENSKPRRGRKPKKADICHLIYKNYGTIFPGTPKDLMDIENREESKCSLLEKRLSNKNKEDMKKPNGQNVSEEPLNLCLRDQSTDSVTISSEGEDSNGKTESNRTTPLTTPTDPATDAFLAANLKMSLPNFQSAMLEKSSEESKTPSTGESSDQPPSPNYVYWPGAGIFIHPMALYYQKMLNAGTLTSPVSPVTSATSTPGAQSLAKKQSTPKPTPKNFPQSMKKETAEQPEPSSTPSSVKSNASTANSLTTANPQPPQKRKRSAIFIPPMPAENTSNPATEVSICKFKFTGGAKPSLQEKKMLSVDSDGNYRYYSGTGDKSMRGYEFFPRESLQQSGVLPGVNCAGAFLNATGEKISHDIPPPSAGLSNELLQIPDSPTGSLLLPQNARTPPSTPSTSHLHRQLSGQSSERRKRKSRRSLQREKLEQTFKEKGFLIQTQQLESAEGATYCKFRQLRKFTRYLFRSWKDYLPGELQQANAAAVAAATGQNSTVVRNLLEASSNKTVIEKPRKN